MTLVYAAGIDPGLVHTGVVQACFDDGHKTISVQANVVDGIDVDKVKLLVHDIDNVFIEGYRERSNFQTNKPMIEGLRDLKKGIPHAKVLNNTGIKTTVKPGLLSAMGLWRFSTPTHHDDLRSAARIMVLGMLKDKGLNALLSDMIRDNLHNQPWHIR